MVTPLNTDYLTRLKVKTMLPSGQKIKACLTTGIFFVIYASTTTTKK